MWCFGCYGEEGHNRGRKQIHDLSIKKELIVINMLLLLYGYVYYTCRLREGERFLNRIQGRLIAWIQFKVLGQTEQDKEALTLSDLLISFPFPIYCETLSSW